jgi:hypothetical protein
VSSAESQHRDDGFFYQMCDFSEAVVLLQAYFDESEREGGVFCVAGYAFAPHQAKKFTKEWSRLFSAYPGGLHMRDLTHRSRAFKGISAEEQHRLIVEAVKIVNRRITAGFAVSCNIREVELLSPKWIRGFRHAYALCCHLSMVAVGTFLAKTGNEERVNYVFESGHPHEAEARDFMRHVVQNPDVKESYRHSGDAFLSKADAVPLQAADMLAWEWAKFRDETLEQQRRPIRKSLLSLFASNLKLYSGAHVTGEPLAKFMLKIRELGLIQIREEEEAKARPVRASTT